MKDFGRSGSRLSALPFQARLVYSVFLAFTLAALAFTAWLGEEMLGADLGRTREYYAGVSDAPHLAARAETAGPTIDMPATALEPPARDPIALRKLLEVTHFHLFSMPVYLMILSHLFMLSGLGARTKTTWISLATLAVLVHIAAPWIARSDAGFAKLVYGSSGALLALTFLVMSGVALFEMWRPRSARPSRPPRSAA